MTMTATSDKGHFNNINNTVITKQLWETVKSEHDKLFYISKVAKTKSQFYFTV